MMITILAIATAVASLFLIVGGLRMVAHDTLAAVAGLARRAYAEGELPAKMALLALWVMIFALSYL